MQSANLSFNVPLFKKQTKRFWSLWSLYSVWLLMSMPVVLYVEAENARPMTDLFSVYENYIGNMAGYGAVWLQFIFCALIAMALWSYLYNNRSVSMLHALPITRGTHFLTNYITGLAFTIVPSVVVFGVSLAVQAVAGAVTLRALGFWLLSQVLTTVFFFSFATLLAFITGSIFALPVLYGVFSVLMKVIVMLVDGIFGVFVYGYAGNWGVLDWIGEKLSPIYTLSTTVRAYHYAPENMDAARTQFAMEGKGVLIAYAIAGLVMAVLAYLLYRRRRLELCGEVITVGALRPVFKYGFTLCASLVGGFLFFEMFSPSLSRGIGYLLFFLLLWAAIGYFAAEMLLRRSAKIFRKSMPGCIATLLLLTAVILGMEYDVTGYEQNIPDSDTVLAVSLYDTDTIVFDSPGDIVSTVALHRQLVEKKSEIDALNDAYRYRGSYQSTPERGEYAGSAYITLRYQLDNGQVLTRKYTIPLIAKDFADPNSVASRFEALVNTPTAVMERHFPKSLGDSQPTRSEIQLFNYKSNPLPADIAGVDAPIDGNYTDADSVNVSLSGETVRGLYAALRADIAAGRLGKVRFIPYDKALMERTYASPLYFNFSAVYNSTDANSISGRNDTLYGNGGWEETKLSDGSIMRAYYHSLELSQDATETLAYLKTLGINPDVHFRTLAQIDKTYAEQEKMGYMYGKYPYERQAGADYPYESTSETSVVPITP